MKEEISRVWDYNFWAMGKFKAQLEEFSEDEFVLDLGDGCGSLRDKLAHILAADKVWMERIQGEVSPFMRPSEIENKKVYLELLEKIHSEYRNIIKTITDEKLKENISYKNLQRIEFSTPLFEVLFHIANHATYHRGQAASLIRRIKGKPPVTDMIEYFREKSS